MGGQGGIGSIGGGDEIMSLPFDPVIRRIGFHGKFLYFVAALAGADIVIDPFHIGIDGGAQKG